MFWVPVYATYYIIQIVIHYTFLFNKHIRMCTLLERKKRKEKSQSFGTFLDTFFLYNWFEQYYAQRIADELKYK